MNLLLINPPFASPVTPYLSIPTLVPYLRSKNIAITVLDTNIEVYHELLAPHKIREGRQFAQERVALLEEKGKLKQSDLLELEKMKKALRYSNARDLRDEFILEDFHNGRKIETDFLAATLSLAASPFFPESLNSAEFSFINYASPYDEFSSKDILKSITSDGILSGFFEKTLTRCFNNGLPRVAGISVYFQSQVLAAFRCASVIKKLAPTVHVTMGGPFISCFMRKLEEDSLFKAVDSFILDDGEIPLERLLQELSAPHPDLSTVPGLVYRSGGIRKNMSSQYIDLECLPVPAYDIFPLDEYLLPRNNMPIPFRLSKGCYWGKCAFCRTDLSLINHYDQSRADYLFDQIEALIKQTGSRIFTFTDDSSSPEILEALSRELIERQINISWTTNLRFDPKLTIERCMLYRQAGCYMVYMGLEAYNDRILRLMKKGTTIKLVDRTLSNMSWAGLRVSVYMIVGFPTETEAEAVETSEDIKRLLEEGLISRYMYHTFNITPYSDVYNNPQSYGFARYIHQRDKTLTHRSLVLKASVCPEAGPCSLKGPLMK